MWNIKALALTVQTLLARFKFSKMGQTPRSRSQGKKKQWYPQKGLITRNTQVKYQSSSTHCSKVISKVKVSERRTEWQNDRMTDRTKTICPPIFDLGGIKTVIKGKNNEWRNTLNPDCQMSYFWWGPLRDYSVSTFSSTLSVGVEISGSYKVLP